MTEMAERPQAPSEWRSTIPTAKVDTMPVLLGTLQAVQDSLPDEAEHIVPFAKSYLRLTELAHAGIEQGTFSDVPTTERLATTFATWYFNPLAAHLDGQTLATPRAWQYLLDGRQAKEGSLSLQLALGLNAHINHDLAYALFAAEVPVGYAADFFKVNRIIKDSAPTLSTEYLPHQSTPVRLGIAAVTTQVICGWRKRAWQNFTRLQRGEDPAAVESDVVRRSIRIAQSILLAHRSLDAAGIEL